MGLEGLFEALSSASSTTNELQGHLGRSYGTSIGTVATEEDRQDPLGLGRVRALVPSKGAKTKTDWLLRLEPQPGLHLPVPKVGDTILIGYLDGDPHKGVYYGVAQNRVNPAWEVLDGLRLQVGQVTLTIHPDGRLDITGLTTANAIGDTRLNFAFPQINLLASGQINLTAANINLSGATSIGFATPSVSFMGIDGAPASSLAFDTQSVTFRSPTVAFDQTSSMYIGSSAAQVATIGAIDSDSDTLVTKGW